MCVARGELEIEPDDMFMAAHRLVKLSTTLIQDKALFLGHEQVTDEDMRRSGVATCKLFMACYGVHGHANALAQAKAG